MSTHSDRKALGVLPVNITALNDEQSEAKITKIKPTVANACDKFSLIRSLEEVPRYWFTNKNKTGCFAVQQLGGKQA